ncbi:MAG: DUF4331 domain-containing protein [Frankiaceae bacterium]|nr:DUF4331 domain-containing protein [Frankiaceae bacterium]
MARPPRTSRRRRAIALAATAATGLAGTAVLLAPTTSSASSHREAPFISEDAEADNTDLYAFVSPDDEDSVTLIGNWWPFADPQGGPNFYKFADDGSAYDINIDNDGDSVADITYRWTFTSSYRTEDTILYNTGVVDSFEDTDLNFRQTYDLVEIREGGPTTVLLNDAPVAPSNVGPTSMPDYPAIREGTLRDVPGGGESFAGQADDSFFLDLRIFDLLYGGDLSEVGVDTLDGYNVQTIALEVPKTDLALNGDASATGNPVVGIWTTTSRPTTRVLPGTDAAAFEVNSSADLTQVSRLGNPLVNEVVIPIKDKDKFNASEPVNDAGSFLSYVQNPEVPKLIDLIYGLDIEPDTDAATPGTQREDLIEVFLTGVCKKSTNANCLGSVPALEADLNSLLLNRDNDDAIFKPSEMLRLNMSVPVTADPKRLGVLEGDLQGYPNGRRLTDDVTDIELKVLEGALTGTPAATIALFDDQVDSNDVDFLDGFPYVAQPHNQAVNRS